MACPVNHPLFHALVFLIGILVVLSRYVRADGILSVPPHGNFDFDFGFAATGTSSTGDLVDSDWVETMLSLTGGVGAGILLMVRRRGSKGRSIGERSATRHGLAWQHELGDLLVT
ncbi:hypothetical protein BCV69DRAFT_312652 [Microstroma glucosiphilum]|uniref:Uncharacterized protein n=1 Tax=Pseudomicrostroma glucosiphilum TaxID=1684307 RepID=A0A316U8A4_9BASI|nr:hypothetical protein BCV69DRAFT_312652 [Pseudomicrostroma glucosiphilum]PWN20701.1 hypothetical protein BCV69DRAFT_312652 [Pseudomicrostroma glucosiphilum]